MFSVAETTKRWIMDNELERIR